MQNSLQSLLETSERMRSPEFAAAFARALKILTFSLKKGGKIMVAGNGGSAAEAQHFAAELVCSFLKRRRALPALALTTDTSVLTAWGNDVSFENVFARQVEALGKKEDALLLFSTSGNSKNIILAAKQAKKQGIKTVALLGGTGGTLRGVSDAELIVPSVETPRIQEIHLLLLHSFCEALEEALT